MTRLRVYPVKSFAGNDVGSARVLPWGLEDDRRWGVVDPQGEPITAREVNGLLGLTADVRADGGLLLSDGRTDPLRVDVPVDADPVAVGHSRQGEAVPAGAAADTWITARIGRDARLVWQPDPRARSVNPKHGGRPGDHLSLADAGPLLLTSEASLARLNGWIHDELLDMVRFRPNVVIDGELPFAEDEWSSVRLGGVRFRVAARCDRCVMTTIDPATLARGKEPIRTLAKHRRSGGKTYFGVRIVPELDGEEAVLSVGDAVVAD